MIPFDRPAPVRSFSGEQLLQIAMPMGGIGAGSICLNGHGGLQDFSVHHHPSVTALPDRSGREPCGFGILHCKGNGAVTRLIEGPLPRGKIYDQGLQGQGYRHGGHEGLPRFRHCRFIAGYPFGEVELSDDAVPLDVRVTGWNPFVPLDDVNSGIPCALLEYSFTNTSAAKVDFEFSYHLSHFARGSSWKRGRNKTLPGTGVLLYNTEPPNAPGFGSACLAVLGSAAPRIKGMWLRGWRYDWMIALWKELTSALFSSNDGNALHDIDSPNGGSVLVSAAIEPGESVVFPIVIAWYFPNCTLVIGEAQQREPAPAGAGDAPPAWRPFYAGQWSDAADVAAYVREHYSSLRRRTLAFQHALAASTMPPEIIDAVTSNLAILKSPTVLRQANGNLWGWEGCQTTAGSCHGSCTHVWNYAQALAHLYPALERTLREAELVRSMDDAGHVQFRAALPDGPAPHDFHPAADGQLGGIMKLYRDWQICGDRTWLGSMYPLARRSLEYCINRWDHDHRGALFEPHHNTYDIEFWGPDSMCTSIYLGALRAASAMARELGFSEDALRYDDLADRGRAFADATLFNNEYYSQKVMWRELGDSAYAQELRQEHLDEELRRVLEKEGPKYQYGDGCLSDGVIGSWMSAIYGLPEPLTAAHVRSTLAAIVRHNFKQNLWTHACTQRPGYANGDEAGLLLCTWPRGGRPTLPFIYCDEVWTGIEFQVASHLIEEGFVAHALSIVRAVRARYDGVTRNPFNEYECGSYYARAMASFAMVNSLAGFRYSAVSNTLWLNPNPAVSPWRGFFSTATAFGILMLDARQLTIDIIEGELILKKLIIRHAEQDCLATLGVGTATFELRGAARHSP